MNKEKKVRKIVMSNLPNFWLYVVFSFVFALIIQLIGLIPPLFMKRVVDVYIPNKDLSSALISILCFVFIPILTTLFSTIYNYSLNVAGRRMGQSLTTLGFEKLIFQPVKYFDEKNSAEVAAYCKSEAMNYVVFWIFDIPQLIAGILGGMVVYLLIIDINVYVAIILLFYIPLSILPSRYFSRAIDKYIKKITKNNAISNQLITDTFKGIKFVKSMMLEKTQIFKMNKINEDTVSVWSKTVAIDNLNGTWTSNFIDNLFTGIVFSVSAILIINNKLTLGMLILLLNYSPIIFSAIRSISNTNFNFKKQLAQFDEFFKIIIMDDERKNDINKKEFVFNNKIEFEDVSFAYLEDRGNVLNKLKIEINKNQWIGIAGRSGAGKTTIFDLILKFYDDYLGNIFIDGVDIKDISTDNIRRNITKVSQDMFLFPGTLKENLLLAKPDASSSELESVIDSVGLTDFIKKLTLGLETYVGEDGIQLSGGEKQRICLAQGLLRNSKILLLDEVTANVDVVSEDNIKNNITNLMKTNDLTVISISHRLNFLDNTDLIFVLENSKLVEKGTYNDLVKSNKIFNNTEEMQKS